MGRGSWERQVLIISKKLDFGVLKKANAVVGKGDTVWSVFLEIYYGLVYVPGFFVSFLKPLWPSITILTTRILRDNILVPLSLQPCKLNTFVLLLVNQQFYLARQCCILWSLFPVPECPYLIPSSFNDCYPWNFISHYHAIPLPPVFSHLNA